MNQKPKKSAFTSHIISNPNEGQRVFYLDLKKVLQRESVLETIGRIPANLSVDGKERPLLLSREIVDKIEFDHGPIFPENMVITADEWEYATTSVLGNPDKINLVKRVPNSHNYLLIAAVRINGFYVVTHFETKTSGNTNLKRLLERGNVISRGPSIGLTLPI